MRFLLLSGLLSCLAPEPGADGGTSGAGGSGGAPAPGPTPPAPTPPTPDAPKAEPPAKQEEAAKPDGAKPPAAEAKPKAKAIIGQLQAKLTSLEASQKADRDELARERFDLELERAGVLPEYHEWARGKLGAIDPKTDDGKAKIDGWAKANAAMTKNAGRTTIDPISAWAGKVKGDAAKTPALAVASMPSAFLEDYARTSVGGDL